MIMTVEKCFALYYLLKSKIICTVKNAKRICEAAGFLLFAFNLQVYFLNKFTIDSNGEKICVFDGFSVKYKTAFYLIDSLLYSTVPTCVILTANFLIILKFLRAKWESRHSGTESVNQALSKSAIKGTVMLLFVSFAFIILTGPIGRF